MSQHEYEIHQHEVTSTVNTYNSNINSNVMRYNNSRFSPPPGHMSQEAHYMSDSDNTPSTIPNNTIISHAVSTILRTSQASQDNNNNAVTQEILNQNILNVTTTKNVQRARRNLYNLNNNNNNAYSGKYCARKHNIDEMNSNLISEMSCGQMDQKCIYCGARYWALETVVTGHYTKCCSKGTVKLASHPKPPPYTSELLSGATTAAKLFKEKSRLFNTNISFGSILMSNSTLPTPAGIPSVRIQGSVYHKLGPTHVMNNNEAPKFLQCYFYENQQQAAQPGQYHNEAFSAAEKIILDKIYDEVTITNQFS